MRERLTEIYSQHNPRKISDIEKLLTEWAGRETTLLANVEAKYFVPQQHDAATTAETGSDATAAEQRQREAAETEALRQLREKEEEAAAAAAAAHDAAMAAAVAAAAEESEEMARYRQQEEDAKLAKKLQKREQVGHLFLSRVSIADRFSALVVEATAVCFFAALWVYVG